MQPNNKYHVCNDVFRAGTGQGSHYILVVKFKDFSTTFKDPKVAFSRTNFRRSLQHGQYYSNI